MGVSAQLTGVTNESHLSFEQLWRQFNPALNREQEAVGKLQLLERLHLVLTLSHAAYGIPADTRRSFSKKDGCYYSAAGIDFSEWEAPDWARRASAVAEALNRAVLRVPGTRLSVAEREQVIAAIGRARDAVAQQPPAEVEPVGAIIPGLVRGANEVAAPRGMFKRYKRVDGLLHYREAWLSGLDVTHHWGACGERGEDEKLHCSSAEKANRWLAMLEKQAGDLGYKPMRDDQHAWLIVEFALDGFDTGKAVTAFRHELENCLDELTGWLGLGHCDGGSIGSGTLEAACPVVDYEVAEAALVRELVGGKFAGYSRIYRER